MRADDTNPQKPWYRLKKVWAIAGVMVLVVVIVAAGVTTEEPTAGDDEVIPTPTARVEPTATPEPTEVIPTPTARVEPTATSEPTEEGCPTPTEGAYLLSYGTLLIEVSRILGELVEAGDLAVVDATVMLDDDWAVRTNLLLTMLAVSAHDFLDLTPPPSLQSAHEDVQQMAEYLLQGVARYGDGIDNFDADLLEASNQNFILANEATLRADSKVMSLCP